MQCRCVQRPSDRSRFFHWFGFCQFNKLLIDWCETEWCLEQMFGLGNEAEVFCFWSLLVCSLAEDKRAPVKEMTTLVLTWFLRHSSLNEHHLKHFLAFPALSLEFPSCCVFKICFIWVCVRALRAAQCVTTSLLDKNPHVLHYCVVSCLNHCVLTHFSHCFPTVLRSALWFQHEPYKKQTTGSRTNKVSVTKTWSPGGFYIVFFFYYYYYLPYLTSFAS